MGNTSGNLSEPSNRFCLCMLEENYVDNNDHKWILCANCNNWFHVHCVLLSDEVYNEILLKNEKWICSGSKCSAGSSKQLEKSSISENQSFKCSECEFIAKNSRGLKIHSHTHKKEKSINSQKVITPNNSNENIPLRNELDQIIFKCIPCNRSFDSSKGLKIHESFHKKIQLKIQSKESMRKTQISTKKLCGKDSTDIVEEIANLNDLLLINQNGSDRQSSSQPSDVHISSEFLKNRVTCDCGFIAKNSHGLKIHQNIHKIKKINEHTEGPSIIQQDRVDQHLISNHQDETNVDLFGLLLSKCKEVIPVVRIIQKSVRSAVSLELSKTIDQVVSKNDENSWFRLLAFPYAVLRLREKKLKGGPNVIRENLKEFEQITNMIEFLSSLLKDSKPKEKIPCSNDEQVVKTVNRKLGEGDFSGAMLVLCSNETIAEINDDTLLKLESKHPSDQLPIIDETIPEECLPATSIDSISKCISSFSISSSSGIDGLRPRHIKDLTSFTCGDAAEKLKNSIAKLVDLAKNGKINKKIVPIFYSGRLIAFIKDNGDVRPIAVGTYWRRLSGKIACFDIKDSLSEILKPHQLGFGAKGGAEAIIHAVRSFVNMNHDQPMVLMKLDYSNAFNMLKRQFLLDETKSIIPGLLPMLNQAYGSFTNLYFNHKVILSRRGVHQGDPLGPPGFCIGTSKLVNSLSSRLNGWYLDDGTIGDKFETIMDDIKKVSDFRDVSGLSLNPSKCEVLFINATKDQKEDMFKAISEQLPGIRLMEEVDLLGSPIHNSLIPKFLQKKKEIVKSMCERLKLLNIHPALCLFRYCMSSPKFIYLLRTCPTFTFKEILSEIDEFFRLTLEKICNIKMCSDVWKQASLPFSFAGLGIRKLEDLALPAYLSSIFQSKNLSNELLAKLNDNIVSIEIQTLIEEMPLNLVPNSVEKYESQSNWDYLNMKLIFEELLLKAGPTDRARLLASSKNESSKWLQVIPSPELGLLLDNNTTRISIALRLGAKVCEKHFCRCGKQVETNGHHGLSCPKNAGRLPRHSGFNKIIGNVLSKVDFPNLREPPDICRSDGKRVDGVTIHPWERGKSLLWDATISDTIAPSYVSQSARCVGSVADQSERHKHNHYMELKRDYVFTPVAFETFGPMGEETKIFINKIGKLLKIKTGEKRSTDFLLQQLSIEIQRGNAASILKTFEADDQDKISSIFDLL